MVVSPMLLRMRESESGTLPRAKVWYGAKPNNRVSQQTQAKSEMLAKGESLFFDCRNMFADQFFPFYGPFQSRQG